MGCLIESRLMMHIDEMGQSFESKVEGLFDSINKKIDLVVKQMREIRIIEENSATF